MRQTIKISEIKVNPRMRQRVDNLDGLADSIRRNDCVLFNVSAATALLILDANGDCIHTCNFVETLC